MWNSSKINNKGIRTTGVIIVDVQQNSHFILAYLIPALIV